MPLATRALMLAAIGVARAQDVADVAGCRPRIASPRDFADFADRAVAKGLERRARAGIGERARSPRRRELWRERFPNRSKSAYTDKVRWHGYERSYHRHLSELRERTCAVGGAGVPETERRSCPLVLKFSTYLKRTTPAVRRDARTSGDGARAAERRVGGRRYVC